LRQVTRCCWWLLRRCEALWRARSRWRLRRCLLRLRHRWRWQ